MTFDELYKKVIDAQRAFEERHIPIYLDFKIEDLRDVLVETKDTIEKLKQKLQDQCISCPVKMQEDDVVAELKQELEDAKATAYAESVDAGMENRRLKRALWLARAEKAKTAKNKFDILWKFASREKVGVTGCAHKIKGAKTLKEPKFFFAKFQIVENKCIEKAEAYK